MENKDFRDRLKEHAVPVKKEAWEMMQVLLESSPEELNEKKRKRRIFFWIWFLGIGILTAGMYYFNYTDTSNHFKNSYENDAELILSEQKIELEGKNEFDENENFDVVTDNKINTNVIYERHVNNIEDDYKDNENRLSIDKININSQTGQDNIVELNTEIVKEETTESNDLTSGMSSGLEESFGSTDREKSSEESFLNSDKNTDVLNGSNNIELNNKLSVNQSHDIEINNLESEQIAQENKNESINLQIEKLLEIDNLNFLVNESRIIELTNKKENKLYAFGQIGYASFNDNPGVIIGGGVQYQFDKLLYFESLLSYANGRETGFSNGEEVTSENEIDLGLILNLNLITARKSTFAFELGYGITKYWGQRIIRSTPIRINERSSFGTHIQAGLSYQHFINRKTAMSLKLGVISYDDAIAYLALKFYKKI